MIRVALLFGGRSPEHWISVKSGLFAGLQLDPSRFEVTAFYLTPQGTWGDQRDYLEALERFQRPGAVKLFREGAEPGDWGSRLKSWTPPEGSSFPSLAREKRFDVVFPVFHGRPGEDGSAQALISALGLPCAGCSLQGAALGMDKALTKALAAQSGISVAPGRIVPQNRFRLQSQVLEEELINELGLPLFVKPAVLGSSLGVGRAVDREGLHRALTEGFSWDDRLLVEKEIRGREYSVGVLGRGDSLAASAVAEYTMDQTHFSYDDKYGPGALDDIIPARLVGAETRRLQDLSLQVCRILGIRGICRVDWFLGPDGLILNEVNTMPGLGPGSVFVRIWEAAGVGAPELLEKILSLAEVPG